MKNRNNKQKERKRHTWRSVSKTFHSNPPTAAYQTKLWRRKFHNFFLSRKIKTHRPCPVELSLTAYCCWSWSDGRRYASFLEQVLFDSEGGTKLLTPTPHEARASGVLFRASAEVHTLLKKKRCASKTDSRGCGQNPRPHGASPTRLTGLQ